METNKPNTAPTHKFIVVNDLNKELSPIGYGFQSPIYRPFRLPIETIGQLLNISKVTAMYEVYEKDHTLKVHLTKTNYRKPFQEIWEEENPGKIFPWSKSVQTVKREDEQPKVDQQPAVDNQPTAPSDDQNDTNDETNKVVDETIGNAGLLEENGQSEENSDQASSDQEPQPQDENTDDINDQENNLQEDSSAEESDDDTSDESTQTTESEAVFTSKPKQNKKHRNNYYRKQK